MEKYQGKERRSIRRRIRDWVAKRAYDPEPLEFQMIFFSALTTLWFMLSSSNNFKFENSIYYTLLSHLSHLVWILFFTMLTIVDILAFLSGFLRLRILASGFTAVMWAMVAALLFSDGANSLAAFYIILMVITKIAINVRLKMNLSPSDQEDNEVMERRLFFMDESSEDNPQL